MHGLVDPISEISEEEKSKKVDGLWQQVLAAREADLKKPALSPIDEKISKVKEDSISKDLFSQNTSMDNEITKLSLNDQSGSSTVAENEPSERKEKKKHINLQWHNIQLAAKLDSLYSSKIRGQGQELKDQLAIQKDLLDLKAMLPKDLSTNKKIELSDKAKDLIDNLNSKHNLNLDKSDIAGLRVQIDSHLDRIKLEVQHKFSDLQTLNHERMLIFQLASRQRNEIEIMVRNQITH